MPNNNRRPALAPYIDAIGPKFHGILSPGLTLGFFMVDYAQELMAQGRQEKGEGKPEDEEGEKKYLRSPVSSLQSPIMLDAIVETKKCLPDAVQLMTPCSYGNGWMKVYDWGRYGLTLYDKRELNGVRVWLDMEKIKDYPVIHDWYFRVIDHHQWPQINQEIQKVQRDVLSWKKVKVKPQPKIKKRPHQFCPGCGESFWTDLGELCPNCSGGGYLE